MRNSYTMVMGMKSRAGITENSMVAPRAIRNGIDLPVVQQDHDQIYCVHTLMVEQLIMPRTQNQPVCPLMMNE